MLTRPRILKYMPPEQMLAADMLIRQKNHKVIDAINKQTGHLFKMQEPFNFKLSASESFAWIRFYKPSTGQEWFITEIQDTDLYCMYYCGEFLKRVYNLDNLRMKDGVVLDIYWSPVTLQVIKETHKNCESNKSTLCYERIMRKGNFVSLQPDVHL